eukprot:1150373-Pelagomonas_calceolata.AAC.8
MQLRDRKPPAAVWSNLQHDLKAGGSHGGGPEMEELAAQLQDAMAAAQEAHALLLVGGGMWVGLCERDWWDGGWMGQASACVRSCCVLMSVEGGMCVHLFA